MAVGGTSIPGDAGVQNLIPSEPRPNQLADFNRDTSAAPDILIGSGDTLPGQTAAKRLHPTPGGGPSDPLSKGHPRTGKHAKSKESDFEAGAQEGLEIEEPASGDRLYEERIEDEYAKREGGA